MGSTTQLTTLETFLQGYPAIKYILPSSPEYPAARKPWNGARLDNPMAVVQPQSPSDVAALVKFAKLNSIPFTIRSGGHNLEGRCVVQDALLIDMRALTDVTISSDRKTATVQGGILQDELANKLWEHGLATPTGAVPTVGYVGWAMYGGYGPFSAHWGLGVDQILGATVVNPNGDIVKADGVLLEGIRGAGGLFGVIIDLTIKVYPLSSLLAGPILFDPTDITKTFIDFNAAYEELLNSEGLPPQLTIQQICFNGPMGRAFGALFLWSGTDIEEGKRWSENIGSLGPLLVNMVAPTTMPEWFVANGAMIPSSLAGSGFSHNVRRMSPLIAETIGPNLAIMPSDPGCMVSIHQLRGPSAGPQDHPSVFATREPHYMLELLGFATSGDQEVSKQWALQTTEEIERADPENLLPTSYISVYNSTIQAKSSAEALEKTYGPNAEVLKDLKAKVDPEGVFALTVPALK
ncbi:D-lactate dehydrogenase [Penicillium cataractarum]|uniref:D-lactate dehydrogenase n=1 Tax=Penicillium cataractarum TaxID=2100454 RepID=A0A9W9RZ18_9EURO|nr:D-lactate dehydrogenase [Penicillium cataractarum]KAJ5368900.1 D-lactate dehydrogenase [Penicillium cataractarum]